MIFEMKKELLYKSTIKGVLAEYEIVAFHNQYFSEKKMNYLEAEPSRYQNRSYGSIKTKICKESNEKIRIPTGLEPKRCFPNAIIDNVHLFQLYP